MKRTKLVIFYKTKSSDKRHNPYHHGGLAANALHTTGVFGAADIDAEMIAVESFADILAYMKANPHTTHVVIEAVWAKPLEIIALGTMYPEARVVVRAHSKMGFLQVEPEAIPTIREIILMQHDHPNISLASNNKEFCGALGEVYGPVLYLPNLYDSSASPQGNPGKGTTLKVGSFGATRLLKLHPNAALAALQLAHRRGRDLEFYINKDNTPGGESVRNTIKNMFNGLDWARLVEIDWQDAETFRETIAQMDLVYQLSCTETFCLVAADAVASGIPVVVGAAISWVPKQYQVNVDDTSEAASVGDHALQNLDRTVWIQRAALNDFVKQSTEVWLDFLGNKKQ